MYVADLYEKKNLTVASLEKFAADPECSNANECHARLEKIRADLEELQSNPFDPRHEVSADARHIAKLIVTNLWVIFVLIPVVIAICYALIPKP